MADRQTFINEPTEQLVRTLQAAEQNTPYRVVLNYLRERGAIPPIRQGVRISSLGSFATGGDLPPTGVVNLGYAPKLNTITHEMTHAAQRQLPRQYYSHRTETTPESRQFRDAYEKIDFNPAKSFRDPARYPLRNFISRLAPDWFKSNLDYRTTEVELPAFAVGNASSMEAKEPVSSYEPPPPHIDPTIATQMLMLLDLATRATRAEKKKSSGSK